MSTALLSGGPRVAEQDRVERFTARGADVTTQLINWRDILAATHLTFEVRIRRRVDQPTSSPGPKRRRCGRGFGPGAR